MQFFRSVVLDTIHEFSALIQILQTVGTPDIESLAFTYSLWISICPVNIRFGPTPHAGQTSRPDGPNKSIFVGILQLRLGKRASVGGKE